MTDATPRSAIVAPPKPGRRGRPNDVPAAPHLPAHPLAIPALTPAEGSE